MMYTYKNFFVRLTIFLVGFMKYCSYPVIYSVELLLNINLMLLYIIILL